MELLLNTEQREGQKEKKMVKNIKFCKSHELCNDPSKICTAFNIEIDDFHKNHISECTELWIEKNLNEKSLIIVTLPSPECPKDVEHSGKRCRYYISGNTCVSYNYDFQN